MQRTPVVQNLTALHPNTHPRRNSSYHLVAQSMLQKFQHLPRVVQPIYATGLRRCCIPTPCPKIEAQVVFDIAFTASR